MGCTEVGHSHPWFLRRHVCAVNCKTETNKATYDLDVATVWFVPLARRVSKYVLTNSTRKEQSAKDKKKAKTMPKEEGDDDGDEESEPEEGRTEKGAISVGSSWAQQPL